MTKAKKKYRVAIVGCGRIGALYEAEPKREKPGSHAGAVTTNGRTELAAFVDTDRKNLAAAQKLFPGVIGYVSTAECLKKERPDIVIIATPPAVRITLLRECARSGVQMVICEKPLATNVQKAKQIEAFVAKNGMTFVLNYQRRFSPLFARLRRDIQEGKLGRIQQVTCYYGNGLYNNGGHIVDALLYLIDESIVSAIGSTNSMNTTHYAGDANIDALMKTKKGITIVLQSIDQKKYGIFGIHIYGTKKCAVLTDFGMTLIETPVGPSRFIGVQQLDAARQQSVHAPFSATKDVLAHVIDCYEKRRVPASSAKSGLAVLRVLDAIAKSARHNGTKVAV